MSGFVWDASAVLAWLRREPGSDRLDALLASDDEHAISTVNLAEVAGWFSQRGMSEAQLAELMRELALDAADFTTLHAQRTGALRASTARQGLSLGDRACLALANIRAATALTADRAWLDVAGRIGVSVECIRPEGAGTAAS